MTQTTYATITTERLQALLEDPEILLVDLRDAAKYDQSHIPGAVNFPFIPSWYNRLFKRRALARVLGPDRTRTIVFY